MTLLRNVLRHVAPRFLPSLSLAVALLAPPAMAQNPAIPQPTDVKDVALAGMAGIGAALASMHDSLMNEEPAQMRIDLVDALRWAASESTLVAIALEEIASNGGPVVYYLVDLYEGLDANFAAAKNAVIADDYAAARVAIAGVATTMHFLSRDVIFGAGQPAVANAAARLDEMTHALAGMDPQGRMIHFIDLMHDVCVEGAQTGLQAEANALMGTTDAQVRLWLELDDPLVIDALQNVGRSVNTAAYQQMASLIESAPDEYVLDMLTMGACASMRDAGDQLVAAANQAGFALLGGCPDLCGNGCAPCGECGEGIGTGLCNPDDMKALDRSLTVVGQLGGKATPGMAKPAAKAAKALAKLLAKTRPRCFVKICWEVCEDVSCWFFWSRHECVKYSQWIEVFPYGNDILSWGGMPWSPAEQSNYTSEKAAAVATGCAGH